MKKIHLLWFVLWIVRSVTAHTGPATIRNRNTPYNKFIRTGQQPQYRKYSSLNVISAGSLLKGGGIITGKLIMKLE